MANWLQVLIQIVFSYLGTFTFGLFIDEPKAAINLASLIGCLGWLLYWLMIKLGCGSVLANFFAAFLVGFLGVIAARKKKMPSTMFSSGLVPLVPGVSGYQALAAIVAHKPSVAVIKIIHVAMVAGAIALGYVLAQVVNELWWQMKVKKKN